MASVTKAQTKIYLLDSNRQIHDLKAYTYVLVDSLEKYTAEQITSGKLDDQFRSYSITPGVKKLNNSYWLRFSIKTNGSVNRWLLILKDSLN